jgi:hypothetical protein
MMYPEDRVLVAYVPQPSDFEIIRQEGWYRIPQQYAPKGLYAEYFAFYFGRHFGDEKWAIHYYATHQGHELVRRLDLFPEEVDHPRAHDFYYKVQLGGLQRLERPIVSMRWRRIAFIHTTWDRFQDAVEINDLFVEGGPYVDRLYAILKDRGVQAERQYRVEEPGVVYEVSLVVPCREGRIEVKEEEIPQSDEEVVNLADEILEEMEGKGGVGDRATDGENEAD